MIRLASKAGFTVNTKMSISEVLQKSSQSSSFAKVTKPFGYDGQVEPTVSAKAANCNELYAVLFNLSYHLQVQKAEKTKMTIVRYILKHLTNQQRFLIIWILWINTLNFL